MRRLRAGLVTPHSGGREPTGGTMTPPRGARWTGTGANASSQETRTREPEIAACGAPRGATCRKRHVHNGTGRAAWRATSLIFEGDGRGLRPTRGRKEYGRRSAGFLRAIGGENCGSVTI